MTDKLPQQLRPAVARRLRVDYHADSGLFAGAQLDALSRCQFRRVNGQLHLPTLRVALERETSTDG